LREKLDLNGARMKKIGFGGEKFANPKVENESVVFLFCCIYT